jgi:group I intron endonuclease
MSERGKPGIYAIRNKETGVTYVGQSSTIGDRWLYHKSSLRRGVHHGKWLQASWNKRGEDAFEFVVLEYTEGTVEALCEAEARWIEKLNPGYNVAPVAGSTLGIKHPPRSEEFRKKMREIKKGFKPSEETRAKLKAIAQKKIADGTMYRPTAEHREKLRAANLGVKHSPERVEANRKRQIGKKLSEAHLSALKKANTGRKCTEATRIAIGRSRSKRDVVEVGLAAFPDKPVSWLAEVLSIDRTVVYRYKKLFEVNK